MIKFLKRKRKGNILNWDCEKIFRVGRKLTKIQKSIHELNIVDNFHEEWGYISFIKVLYNLKMRWYVIKIIKTYLNFIFNIKYLNIIPSNFKLKFISIILN